MSVINEEEALEYQARLEQDLDQFNRSDDTFEEDFNKLVQKIEKGNQHLFEKYISKVGRNIEAKAELLFDYSDAAQQQSYLETSIFQLGWLKSEVGKLHKKYAGIFAGFLRLSRPKAVFKEYEYLSVDRPTPVRQEVQLRVDSQSFDFDASVSVSCPAQACSWPGTCAWPLGSCLGGDRGVCWAWPSGWLSK